MRDYLKRIEQLKQDYLEEEGISSLNDKSVELFLYFIATFPCEGTLSVTPEGYLYFSKQRDPESPQVSMVFKEDCHIKFVYFNCAKTYATTL
jgi:hypothetical protein